MPEAAAAVLMAAPALLAAAAEARWYWRAVVSSVALLSLHVRPPHSLPLGCCYEARSSCCRCSEVRSARPLSFVCHQEGRRVAPTGARLVTGAAPHLAISGHDPCLHASATSGRLRCSSMIRPSLDQRAPWSDPPPLTGRRRPPYLQLKTRRVEATTGGSSRLLRCSALPPPLHGSPTAAASSQWRREACMTPPTAAARSSSPRGVVRWQRLLTTALILRATVHAPTMAYRQPPMRALLGLLAARSRHRTSAGGCHSRVWPSLY